MPAARKGADAVLVARLLKYVDQQLKDHPEESRWRAEKYHLLVALDRAKELISRALKAEPDNEAFLDSMGWVLFKLNQPEAALEHLLKAVEKSDKPDATIKIAKRYGKKKIDTDFSGISGTQN